MKTQWWIGTQKLRTNSMSSLPYRTAAVSSTEPALMLITAMTP